VITIDTPDFTRDRWGRPLVTDPTGGTKPLAYGRPSSFGKCIDDDWNLQLWAKRKVLEGLVKDHALYATACALTFDDTSKEAKAEINKVVEKALAAVRTDARAELGTALHTMTEKVDRGEVMDLPPVFRADVDAYQKALAQAGFRVVPGMIELHCVCDELELAGSFDRLLEHIDTGTIYVGDLKTGASVDYPHGYAVQLAVYANSLFYDVDTGQRSPMPDGLSRDHGVIIHLPAGEGSCSVHYIDLAKGWKAAGVAAWVKRDWQKDKGLLSPVVRIAPPAVAAPAPPVEHLPTASDALAALRTRIADLSLEQRAQLKAVWPSGVNLNKMSGLGISEGLFLNGLVDAVDGALAHTDDGADVYEVNRNPDEGGDADPGAIAALRSMTAAIPPNGGAQWLTRTVHGCELAGASISLNEKHGGRPSLRRFELCRALYLLAKNEMTDRLDDMVRATVGDVPGPTVALLASMGVDEATTFALHVTALVAGVEGAAALPITAA
jgi:hypothetical protein